MSMIEPSFVYAAFMVGVISLGNPVLGLKLALSLGILT
jgi:hypothetical protein